MGSICSKIYPQDLWNVDRFSVEEFRKKMTPQSLWKKGNCFTSACGEKAVGTLGKKPVFHINLYYYCYDCLN